MSSNCIVDGKVVLKCSLCNESEIVLDMQVGESIGSFINRIIIALLSDCPNKARHKEIGTIER